MVSLYPTGLSDPEEKYTTNTSSTPNAPLTQHEDSMTSGGHVSLLPWDSPGLLVVPVYQ